MFSQTAEYALRAAVVLALFPDELVASPELAKTTGVPPNYLSKVLQQLAQADLITGRRGVGGGYKLARPADEITLLQIVRTVEQLERIDACPLGPVLPRGGLCALHRRIDMAFAAIIEILDDATLGSLISDPSVTPFCGLKAPPPEQD